MEGDSSELGEIYALVLMKNLRLFHNLILETDLVGIPEEALSVAIREGILTEPADVTTRFITIGQY